MIALAHPGLLWSGLALASVPILIHLFFRRRHRVVRWAAMEWLLAALKKQKRRMQVENLILLILRCALIVLLGLAIARPAVRAAALSPLGGGTRNVVLVMDTSASMGAQQTGRRALDRARERATRVLSDLSSDSKVTVIATRDDQIGGAPRVLLESATPSEARGRLGSLAVSNGPNRLGAVFRLVAQRLLKLGGRKMVVMVTDLQRRDWRDDKGRPHKDVYVALRNLRPEGDEEAPPVTLLDIGLPGAGNVAIADFNVARGREAIAGSTVELTVTLANYGPRPVAGAVRPSVTRRDGTRERKQGRNVTVPPTTGALGPAYVSVPLYVYMPPESAGHARFEVEFEGTGADRMPADSRRYLALDVKPPVRFLPVRLADVSLEILQDVGDVSEVIEVRDAVSPAALATKDLSAYDAIIWADADPFDSTFEEKGLRRLEYFVRRGGGLIFYLGKESVPDRMNKLFHKDRGKGLFPMLLDGVQETKENPVRYDLEAVRKHPLFLDATFGGSPLVEFYHRVKDCPPAKIVARYSNGDPAVIEHRLGRGRVLIVTTTANDAWYRMNGSLLPALFFFNSAHYLSADDGSDRNVLVGEPVKILPPAGARQIIVEPPEGAGGRTEEPAVPEQPFVLTDTSHPGFYRITVRGISPDRTSVPTEETNFAAVNLDAAEGDLRRDDQVAEAYQGTRLRVLRNAEEILPAAAGGDDKGELSRGLLSAVVVMLFLELLLAGRFGTRRAKS